MIRFTIRLTSPKNKFLRASASLCPKKVILVVRSALATLDPSRIYASINFFQKLIFNDCLALPFLRDDGVQFIFDAVYLLALPSTQCQHAVVE